MVEIYETKKKDKSTKANQKVDSKGLSNHWYSPLINLQQEVVMKCYLHIYLPCTQLSNG